MAKTRRSKSKRLVPRRQLPRLAPRAADSHKGDFGRALLIGGSRGMAGAIALAGMACLRSGAGLVRLAVPDCCLETVAQFEPSYMTLPLPCDNQGRIADGAAPQLLPLVEQSTCIACGPGIGGSPDLTYLVRELYRQAKQPLVIDADGLNALADAPAGMKDAAGPRVLTPHPGEFARLCGIDAANRDEQMAEARELAAAHQVVI